MYELSFTGAPRSNFLIKMRVNPLSRAHFLMPILFYIALYFLARKNSSRSSVLGSRELQHADIVAFFPSPDPFPGRCASRDRQLPERRPAAITLAVAMQ